MWALLEIRRDTTFILKLISTASTQTLHSLLKISLLDAECKERGYDTVSYPLPHIRFSLPDCLFAGGYDTVSYPPFPTSVLPCRIASLQGVRHCVVPPFPHPFFPARMPLCRGVRHCVAPPLIRYLTIKNRGDFVNQCTLILADGTEIIIDGDLHHIDFSKCSSEEIISFAKQYLAEHHIFTKEGGSSTHE